MKKLLILITIASLTSCKTETQQTTKSEINYLRIQSIDKNSDTTYSETKIVR